MTKFICKQCKVPCELNTNCPGSKIIKTICPIFGNSVLVKAKWKKVKNEKEVKQ